MTTASRSYHARANLHSLAVFLYIAIMILGPVIFSWRYNEDLLSTYKTIFIYLIAGLTGYSFAKPLGKGDRIWLWSMGGYRKSFQKNASIAILFSCLLIPFILLYGVCYLFALLIELYVERRTVRKHNNGYNPVCNSNHNHIMEIKTNKKEYKMNQDTHSTIDKHQNILISDKKLGEALKHFPLSQILKLRTAIYSDLEGIKEKLNEKVHIWE